MDYREVIVIDTLKRGGKPCVRGMRITVSDVLDALVYLSKEEVLDEYPYLTSDDIQACLAFAADRERKLMTRVV